MKICSVCRYCFDDAAVRCVHDEHPPLTETFAGDPAMVHGYRLESVIDQGAKHATFRAVRLDCRSACRIRILSVSRELGDRFLNDAAKGGTLFHSGIEDIFESGSLSGGEYFSVLEERSGATLRELLETDGPPDLITTIRIVGGAAEALHALHQNGLIHGAVQPEHLALAFDAEGNPTVRLSDADLGGAIARSTVANKFEIDNALDRIRYFAPEQCLGDDVTLRSDIYSLGVVFYELLTGTPPFDAAKATTLIGMHKSQRPPDLIVDDPDLRMLVTHSLFESLQKQPTFRQVSADLFARQMRHIEQLATHVSTPPPAMAMQASASRVAVPNKPRTAPARIEAPVAENIKPLPAPPRVAPVLHVSEPVIRPSDVGHGEVSEPEVRSLEAEDKTHKLISPGPQKPERSNLAARRQRLRSSRRGLAPITQTAIAEEPVPVSIDNRPLAWAPALDSEPEIEPAPTVVAPRKIDWEQPDDDVPSIEAAAAALEESGAFDPSEIRDEGPSGGRASDEDTYLGPIRSDWEPARVDNEYLGPMSALDSRSMSEDDADEITTLEPEPVRITIQWEQPAFQRAHGDQSLDGEESAFSFAPTILGDRRSRRELDGFSWGTLLPSGVGAFKGMPPAPFWVLIMGAGLMLLSGLVLLGDEPAESGLAEIRRDEQPVIASTDRAEAEPPLSAVPTSFVRPAEIQEPAATTKRERERPDSARAVATRSESGTARPSTTVKAGEPASGEPAQPKRRVIVVGSELAKNAARKDVPAAAEQRVNKPRSSREPAAGAVRPRVVTVSKN